MIITTFPRIDGIDRQDRHSHLIDGLLNYYHGSKLLIHPKLGVAIASYFHYGGA